MINKQKINKYTKWSDKHEEIRTRILTIKRNTTCYNKKESHKELNILYKQINKINAYLMNTNLLT